MGHDCMGTNPKQEAAEYDAWFRREVEAGIAEANAGELIPAAEVEAEAAEWRRRVQARVAGELKADQNVELSQRHP